jgi:Terminase large subunit, T4likevirus-type, N-terminal
LLRSTSRYVLLLAARQSGKSLTCALIALGTALTKPGALILVLSPSQRQSAEQVRTISSLHGKLKGAPALSADSVLKMAFANGSRIIALPGSEKTVRGYSAVDLVIIDEASRVDDALISATRPMLATSNGRLIALTTPAGKRGFFFDAWHGDGDFERIKISVDMVPRISEEFLAAELKELGPGIFSQEYGLTFVDNDESVFPHAVIAAAFTDLVRPLWM